MCNADFIMNWIEEAHKSNEEICLAFADGNDEHLWVRKVDKGFFLDSENVFDSSAAPSETEPLLREAGIEIVYEPADIYYGYHAFASKQQFRSLLLHHSATACGIRKFTQEG